MYGKSEILAYLKQNEADNINIINFIESYPIYYLERIGDSVLAKGFSDRNWVYISSKSNIELEIIKSKLDNIDKNFAIIEDWMIPNITNGKKMEANNCEAISNRQRIIT